MHRLLLGLARVFSMASLARTISGLSPELEAAIVATAVAERKTASRVVVEALIKQLLPPVTDRAA